MPSHKFRSKFEKTVWAKISKAYPKTKYEPDFIKYIQPETERTYNPDFKMKDNIYIEAKGKLDLDTRKKMVWFKESSPDVTIIFLFMNPDTKIRKGSKTTYGAWATKNDFLWLDARKDFINDYKELCKRFKW